MARAGGAALLIVSTVLVAAAPAGALPTIIGDGSSFAGIEFAQWANDVNTPQYGNQGVNYQSTSSGQGRGDFCNNGVDFAVTDIRYNTLDDQCIPPDADFAYIPMTAGGISFMYNLQKEGFTSSAKPIQLSAATVCGIFGAGIKYWDDPNIAADNPGVTLPHVPIIPVVRNDPAGTNYVLEQYCIALEPALYAQFVNNWNSGPGANPGGIQYPTNQPTSSWPLLQPVTGATGSNGVAAAVAASNDDGYIGAVETGYALQLHFPVAAVKNDTGAYVLPTAAAVAAALGHATQLTDGTQQLNFTPNDPGAYNPSTYSYMLVHICTSCSTSRSTSVGQAVTAFANYALTLGQEEAPSLGYASINMSLINFGLNRLQVVPGWVAPTAAEEAAINAAGTTNTSATTLPATVTTPSTTPTSSTSSTTPSSSSTNTSTSDTSSASSGSTGSTGSTGSSGVTGTLSNGSSSGATGTPTGVSASSSSPLGSSAASGSSGASGSTGALASLDPTASLSGASGPLAQTGVESDILVGGGVGLLVLGELFRRRGRRRRVLT